MEPSEERDALWLRCEEDLGMFAAVFCDERLPLPFSRFHRSILHRQKRRWTERTTQQRIADAAPRGNAKSTLESYISLIHDAVYGYEMFVGVISTTYDLSEDLVADLHQAFSEAELHPDLHAIYGPFAVIGGKTNFVVHVPGQDPRGTRFAAYSFGGSIRGSKHAGIRFTKIIIDDGEHPEKVRSPAQRDKTWDYLVKDILKAGDKCTIFRVIGTVLHSDSMLNRTIGYAQGGHGLGWQGTRWQAMRSWPTATLLWAACRELWADLTDPDREDTAKRFYRRRRIAMDAGAEVLWPEKENVYDLHVMLWTDGAAAFNSEKQNIATDPTRQVFFPEQWRRCSFDGEVITTSKGRKIRLNTCSIAVWLDPRASQEVEKNDYAALAIAAKDRHGYVYLLSVDMRRDTTAGAIGRIWAAYQLFHNRAQYGYEDNGFAVLMGDLFEVERGRRRKENLPATCNLLGYHSSKNKNDRISSLAPRLDNGWIEVADDVPAPVIEQFRQIPTGGHDDGPDAAERAIWLVDGGARPGWDGNAKLRS